MGTWNTRGLRGKPLEDAINYTNDIYMKQGLAVIQKVPTPITPVQFDSKNKTITLAYFDQKSTVDYIGVVQGIPICFDAKETSHKNLPLQNIHQHQIDFMDHFYKQNGVAFLLVYFSQMDEYFLLPFELLFSYWKNQLNHGRKSIPYQAFEEAYPVEMKKNGQIHYLEALNTYLVCKEKSQNSSRG